MSAIGAGFYDHRNEIQQTAARIRETYTRLRVKKEFDECFCDVGEPTPTQVRKNEECPFCCETLDHSDQLYISPCQHAYHRACLEKWVQIRFSFSCPICRGDFRPSFEHPAPAAECQAQGDDDPKTDRHFPADEEKELAGSQGSPSSVRIAQDDGRADAGFAHDDCDDVRDTHASSTTDRSRTVGGDQT